MSKKLDNIVRKTGSLLTAPPPSNMPVGHIRYAVVTAQALGTSTIQFAGGDTEIEDVKCLYDNFVVGDTVLVVQYGTDQLGADLVILGALSATAGGTTSQGVLAYLILDSATPAGPYAGSGVPRTSALNPTTSISSTGLGLYDFPCNGDRLVEVEFQFFAAGNPNSAVEWYFYVKARKNAGSWYTAREVRHAPAGLNGPSPMGKALIATDSDTTLFSVAIDVAVSSTSPALYQYGGSPSFQHSHLKVTDIGPA